MTLPVATTTPAIGAETTADDLQAFLQSFSDAMCFSDDDPPSIVDRHYPSGIVQRSDGTTFDRERLIAHAKPSRKNTVSARFEVDDAFLSGDRLAARYRLRAETRQGHAIHTEIYMLANLDDSGRPYRIDQITRALPAAE